ncbi:MAG: riboflavin kinase, partial [Planctomycetes bacterium]|nr:riboflavin kinase [Planctomycetota bacterium]
RIPPLCMPADGVYAVRATVPSNALASAPAVANLGTRPTFAGHGPRLEVHVLDQAPDLDLYGATMTVDFVARIRGERRFSSEAQLANQITTDIASARDLLS